MQAIDITVVALDGINSLKTGVGTVVINFMRSIHQLAHLLLDNGITVNRLNALTSFLEETSFDFNHNIFNEVKNVCGQYNGIVNFIHSHASGNTKSEIWMGTKESGTRIQWESLSRNAAKLIENMIHDDVQQLVFAHDTIFSHISKFLPIHKKCIVTWIPHCLGLVFQDRWQDIKISFEREGIQSIIQRHDIIGSISKEFEEKIIADTNHSNLKIYPLSNFFLSEIKNRLNTSLHNTLILQNIDSDNPIIFAWGRCSKQKAWDIFLPTVKTFLESKKGKDFQAVFICSMGTASPSYEQQIMEECRKFPKDRIHLLTAFNEEEPFRILNMSNLKIVAFPSRFEGMSLVAIEALEICNTACTFIHSSTPSFNYLFSHRNNTQKVHENTTEAWSAALCSYDNTDICNHDASFIAKHTIDDALTSYAKIISQLSHRN